MAACRSVPANDQSLDEFSAIAGHIAPERSTHALSVSPRSASCADYDSPFDTACDEMQERLRIAADMLQAMEVQISRAEGAIAALHACQRQAQRMGLNLHEQSSELCTRIDAALACFQQHVEAGSGAQ